MKTMRKAGKGITGKTMELSSRIGALEARIAILEEQQDVAEQKLSDLEESVSQLVELANDHSAEVEGLTECIGELNASVTDLLDRLDVPDTEEE